MKDPRERVYRFRVNNAESEWIESKFRLSSCETLSDFFRTMIMYGIVVKCDEEQLAKTARLIEKTSVNLNQIAVRVNSTNRIYTEDIAQLTKEWDEICQLQKSIQSQLLKLKP